jgi:PAS domain S-box-containing protein
VITDFIVPEDQDRAWSNVALKFAGVITGPDEYRGLRRDGSTFDIEVNGEFIRDADGQPTSVVFVVRDITERKRTDRALRESEIRMRAITDSAQDGIVMMDPEGRVSYWNPAAERMFGYTSAEATGQYLLTLLAPSRYLEAFRAAFPAFLQTGRGAAIGTTLDWMGRRADGQEFPVQLSLSAVQLDGRWHAVGLLQDVTQRKRAEAALRDSEERYRALVEWSPEPTCVHRGGKFIYVNPAFIKMFGATSAQDLVGKPILDRVHPDFHQIVLARAKIIADHGVTPMIEERYRKLDGTAIDVEVQATSIVYDGAPAIHASIRDITERKRAEAEIGALNEELEQRVVARTAELAASNKELESFSYSVSHDLRAPLRAISGFAAILGRRYRDGLDEKGRHSVDTIVDSSEHMGVLIEELLDYSRLGRAIVRAEPVPLGPLVTGLRATFGERIAAAGATLEVIEPLATPVGDPTLLERILANLIDNALTYHRSDVATRVTLSATRRGRRVALAVADNGIGIPAEYRERIFEVFARLHSADEYPGTGIGLSIVRKAARLMGSDVTVESTEGAGSTFSFELPAATKRSSKP